MHDKVHFNMNFRLNTNFAGIYYHCFVFGTYTDVLTRGSIYNIKWLNLNELNQLLIELIGTDGIEMNVVCYKAVYIVSVGFKCYISTSAKV